MVNIVRYLTYLTQPALIAAILNRLPLLMLLLLAVTLRLLCAKFLMGSIDSEGAEYARIADELEQSGFDSEPFGNRIIAVKGAPAGVGGCGFRVRGARVAR